MFCPNCGSKVDEDVYKACPSCKAPLKQQQYSQPQIVVQNQNSNGGHVSGGHSILLHFFFGWMLFYIPTLICLFDGKPWHL